MTQFIPLLLLVLVAFTLWWQIRKRVKKPPVQRRVQLQGGFSTMVVGVSYSNADGMKRQDYINRYANEGTPIVLKREKSNPRDSNAVGVWLVVTAPLGLGTAEVQIGYLSRDTAEEIAPLIDRGNTFVAAVEQVYPGEDDIPSGIAIRIVKTG